MLLTLRADLKDINYTYYEMKHLLLFFCVILLDVAGCSPHDEEKFLNVSISEVFLDSEKGSSATFKVYSNTDWIISCDQGWVIVNPSSGGGDKEISVIALSSNDGPYVDMRYCTVTVSEKGGPIFKTIKVYQKALH